MKKKIPIIVLLLTCFLGFSQKEVTWQDLAKISFKEKFFSEYDEYFLYPEFSPSVKAMEGKRIRIKGYFLNIDSSGELYIISKGPMSACFFCGVGGPETAVEVHFKSTPNFKTDMIIAVTGTLKLNQDDVEHFNYMLLEAEGELIN